MTTATKGPRLLEQGIYTGTILNHELELSKKNTPGVRFTVLLEKFEDELTGEAKEITPVRRSFVLWITPKRASWSISDLQKAGYDRDDASGLDPRGEKPFVFTDLPIRLAVSHREYNERMQEDFRIERKLKTPEETAKAFDAIMQSVKDGKELEAKNARIEAAKKAAAEELEKEAAGGTDEDGVDYTSEDTE